MYQVEFSGTTYWFISNKAGDPSYNIAMFTANAACPDGKNLPLSLKNIAYRPYLTYFIYR